MKALSIAGTAAMFLVGGGILAHGIAPLGHAIDAYAQAQGGSARNGCCRMLANGLIGLVVGALALLAFKAFGSIRRTAAA